MRCLWCQAPVSTRSRRDKLYCCQSHRQAAWRFHHGATRSVSPGGRDASRSASETRSYAYADPPYPGLARRYYAEHPDYAGEVDHKALIERLSAEHDGWALSTSTAALREVLAVCPADVRVAVWVRGARPVASYLPLNAWEPVVYRGARRVLRGPESTRRDVLEYVLRPRQTDTARVIGSKPAAFCSWLFALLGLAADDQLVDVFPGSGRVSQAWETYRLELRRLGELADAWPRQLL